jgi:asparagine synthase (glutamine-hydrolysing)
MPYRYIAILGDRRCGEVIGDAGPALGRSGLMPRLLTDGIGLFASGDTPALTIPGGGILVGRLFREDGMPLRDAGDFPDCPDHRRFREFLLRRCWGEYVLFQPDTNDPASVTVMRDPSGGVPCVYSLEREPCFATSDISLATDHGICRRRIDWEFIAHCLVYPYMMTQRTGLSGVRELLPGSTLRVRGPNTVFEHAWSPWDFVATERRLGDPDEAAARVRHSVRTATRAWAGIDRSILLELSGGLDSSILAACLRDTDAELSCCTLLTSVPGADERQYASLVANNLDVGLRVEELGFELARFDAPPPSWSVSPRINVLQHALNEAMTAIGASESVVSHFSGGGGDTIFCYLGNAAPAADAFRELGISAGATAIRELSHLHQCTLWKAARLTLEKLFRPPGLPHDANTAFLSPQVAAIPSDGHPWFEAPPGALPGDRRRIQLLAGTQLYRQAMSRGASRDLRMPLLSQPVVEACLNVPAWMWIAGGRNRSVARAAFADDLPREVLHRRSKGDFSQYLGAIWQRHKHQMRDFLLEGELQARGLLAPDCLRDFFLHPLPSRDQTFMRTFELCTIENWVRHQH